MWYLIEVVLFTTINKMGLAIPDLGDRGSDHTQQSSVRFDYTQKTNIVTSGRSFRSCGISLSGNSSPRWALIQSCLHNEAPVKLLTPYMEIYLDRYVLWSVLHVYFRTLVWRG